MVALAGGLLAVVVALHAAAGKGQVSRKSMCKEQPGAAVHAQEPLPVLVAVRGRVEARESRVYAVCGLVPRGLKKQRRLVSPTVLTAFNCPTKSCCSATRKHKRRSDDPTVTSSGAEGLNGGHCARTALAPPAAAG